MIKPLLVLCAWFVGAVGCAQSGSLRLVVDPGDSFEFIVDGKRMQEREVTLPAGAHHFVFWAPKHRIVDTTVTVVPDRTLDVVVRLPVSMEYVAHYKEMQAWRGRRKMSRVLPVTVTLASAIWTGVNYAAYKKAHTQLETDLEEYNGSVIPGSIGVLENSTIPEHQDTFQKKETMFLVSGGVTLVCAGITTFLYRRSVKDKVPVFDDKEKLRFDGMAWLPGEQGGQFMGGLTYFFSRTR